jgi:hypothetical protein
MSRYVWQVCWHGVPMQLAGDSCDSIMHSHSKMHVALALTICLSRPPRCQLPQPPSGNEARGSGPLPHSLRPDRTCTPADGSSKGSHTG